MGGQVALVLFSLLAVGACALDQPGADAYDIIQGEPADALSKQTAAQANTVGKRFTRKIFGNFFGGTPSYSCEFVPTVSFYPENASPLPVYRCVLDDSEVLIATSSFHNPASPQEFVTSASVKLDNQVLSTVYPGTFRANTNSLFRAVNSGGTYVGTVAINGLLILSTPKLRNSLFSYFQTDRYNCQFLPYVNFYAEEYGQLPAYKCIRGSNEVLIASNNYKTYGLNSYLNNVEMTLSDAVAKIYFPGSFIQVQANQFTPVTGLDYAGENFSLNGLLLLTRY